MGLTRQSVTRRRNGATRPILIVLLGAALLAALATCGAQSVNQGEPPAVALATVPPATTPAPTIAAVDASPTATAPMQATRPSLPTAQPTAATIACTSPAALTPSLTEGPYFKAGSPERTSLVTPSMAGTQLVLTGYVLTSDCTPVAHALLDFWQADANGHYDNSGYTLRGHQFTDASGRYTLTTIVPGLYPGRTEHIHAKVQAPNGPVLTSQLFFPGVAQNQQDGIFNPALVLKVRETADGLAATFNFVVQN